MIFSSAAPTPLPGRWAAFLLFLSSILLLPAGLCAQDTAEDSYRGVWQIDTPADGPLILIIKKNDRASYFRGSNDDRTVYQGEWSATEAGIEARWGDGSRHQLLPGSSGFEAVCLSAGGAELYRAPAQRVPDEILGQWARPPQVEDDLRSDRDQAEGFFGVWEVDSEDGTHYVFVEPDRSAASTWAGGPTGDRGLRGAWARQGSELHIVWDTGHYSILKEGTRAFSYVRLEPGMVIEDNKAKPVATRRTRDAKIDASWTSRYEDEKAAGNSGISFASSRDAQRFYRGNWIVKRGGDVFERIEVGRFGGLSTSRKAGLDGEWRLSGQDLFMRWDDGMRKILSPVGDGFVLYEYRAGRPLDGVPTRILPATPADSSKLDEYLAGRSDVAEQIRTLAEAAGMGMRSETGGIGRTFMRWAWPFGEGSGDAQTLLEQEFESSADPWWWPFWSEQAAHTSIDDEPDATEPSQEDEAKSAPAKDGMIEIPLPASLQKPEATGTNGEAEAPAASGKDEPARRGGKWLWPF